MSKLERMMAAIIEMANIEKAKAKPIIADGRKSDKVRQKMANQAGKAICFQGLSKTTKSYTTVKKVVLPMPVEGGVSYIRSGGKH